MVLQLYNVLSAFTRTDYSLNLIVCQAFVGLFLGSLCLSRSLCVALVAFIRFIFPKKGKSAAVVFVLSRCAFANVFEILPIVDFVFTKFL